MRASIRQARPSPVKRHLVVMGFFIFIGLLAQQSQAEDRTKQSKKPDYKAEPADKGPTASPFPGAPHPSGISQPSTHPQHDFSDEKPQDFWKKVFAPESASNWVLVIVGGCGLLFALRTLVAVEKQAKANEISAQAAKSSAETAERTLKLTQRAHIILAEAQLIDGNDNVTSLSGAKHVDLVFRNVGKTSAENVVFDMRLEIEGIPHRDIPVKTPVLAQGEKKTLRWPAISIFAPPSTINKVASGEITLKYTGTVTYTDVFRDVHTFTPSGTFDPVSAKFYIERHDAT